MAASTSVVVPVRSAWASRINQIAVAVFGLAVPIGALAPILPDKWKPYAVAAASFIGGVGIVYYRTFGTASVTPSSVANPALSTPTIGQIMERANVPLDAKADILNQIELDAIKH